MPGYRSERASQRVQQEISLLLYRDLSDPRLVGANVTRVAMSADLRYARVYVSPLATEKESRQMLDGLRHAAGYIRHRLTESLDMKFAPEVRFEIDQAIIKGERFLQVLEQVQAEERARKKISQPRQIKSARKLKLKRKK